MTGQLGNETVNGSTEKVNKFLRHLKRDFKALSSEAGPSIEEPDSEPRSEVTFKGNMGSDIAQVRIYSNGAVVLSEDESVSKYEGEPDKFVEGLEFKLRDSIGIHF